MTAAPYPIAPVSSHRFFDLLRFFFNYLAIKDFVVTVFFLPERMAPFKFSYSVRPLLACHLDLFLFLAAS